MPKNLNAVIFKWYGAILPGQNNFICVFLRNKYGLQMFKMAWYSKTYTLLKSVHNDLDHADDADNADDTDNYNRVIGISKWEQKIANTHPNKCTHVPTHRHPNWMITILSAYGWA